MARHPREEGAIIEECRKKSRRSRNLMILRWPDRALHGKLWPTTVCFVSGSMKVLWLVAARTIGTNRSWLCENHLVEFIDW